MDTYTTHYQVVTYAFKLNLAQEMMACPAFPSEYKFNLTIISALVIGNTLDLPQN